MGTRSLTFVHDEDGTPIVCIYKQYDGYFSGVGDDILTFLKGTQVVNGIGMSPARIFNGAGDLAARLITYYKGGNADDAGNTYIMAPDTSDVGEEFTYHVHCTVGQEPRLVATDIYAKFTVDAPVSEVVWPQRDDDGNYIVADPNAPITKEQRRALFATFTEVFGESEQAKRLAFTKMVLGGNLVRSWSAHKPGALTVSEASKVLDALDNLNV